MPDIVANIDKKQLISMLAGLSIASFIFYHVATKTIGAITKSGASRIEQRNQKLHLFEEQQELTQNSYTRYIDTVACVAFVFLGIALLFSIYPGVAGTILGFIISCIIVCLVYSQGIKVNIDTFSQTIQKKLPTLSGIGFFLTFSYVLADYIFFSIPDSFILLLVSIILGRQLLTRTNVIVRNLFFFNSHNQKLRALLFHGEVFQPATKESNSIWDFLDSGTPTHQRLQETLKLVSTSPENEIRLTWQDSGLPGIFFLKGTTENSDQAFLVKIFEKKKTKDARHEATLLLDAPEALPCPQLVLDTVISGLIVHILNVTDYSNPQHSSSQQIKNDLVLSISNVELSSTLHSRYVRSHSMLWDQIEQIKFHKLQLVCEDDNTVDTFLSKLPKIREELKRLPLRLHNSQLTNANLYTQSPTGEIQLLHWGKWSLEPLGAGLVQLSQDEPSPELLSAVRTPTSIKDSSEQSPDPRNAFLAHKLQKQVQQQLLLKSLDTMKSLSNCIK